MLVIAEFILLALAIMFLGNKLSKYADLLAEMSGMGKGFVGIILLGGITSLPELITTTSAIYVADSPNMAFSNCFGSNVFNIMILAILDFFYVKKLIDDGHLIVAFISILLTMGVMAGLYFAPQPAILHVSILSQLLIITYVLSMYMLYRFDRTQLVDEAEVDNEIIQKYTLTRIITIFAVISASIIGVGVLLVYVTDQMTVEFNLSQSFAGGLLLAVCTSLPELVVSIAAVRLGSQALAYGNIFGSNSFNMLIIGIADLVTSKPIFDNVSLPQPLMFAGTMSILLTCIAILGVLLKSRVRVFRAGIDALLIIAGYIFFAIGLHSFS